MMADPTYQFPIRRKPMPYLQAERGYPPTPTSTSYAHSRTRTNSSSVFPADQSSQPTILYTAPQQQAYNSRRTPSTNTFSTTGTGSSMGNSPAPNRQSSTSSRSGSLAPTSYVALMRKQKATVWCDRAQHEDPRMLAAQRAAKQRASNEILGVSTSGRTGTPTSSGSFVGTSRVAAKIRHHGKAGVVGYTPLNENFGVGVGGVPMRLSASEVENGDSDEDQEYEQGGHHKRTGSGKSSLGSARAGRGHQYRQSTASGHSGRWSQGHTPPSERERDNSLTDPAEATPLPHGHPRHKEYLSEGAPGIETRSTNSGSSGERNDSVAELGNNEAARLASNSLLKSTVTRERSTRNPEELRRRGSVDERTMTMSLSAGRLFVANPDVDSD